MIYADENVWMPVVEGLRRRGWSVTTAMDEGTLGDPDVDQLAHAASNGWPLLTFDDDFLSMVESGEFGRDHAGIVFSHSTSATWVNSSGVSTRRSSTTPTVT